MSRTYTCRSSVEVKWHVIRWPMFVITRAYRSLEWIWRLIKATKRAYNTTHHDGWTRWVGHKFRVNRFTDTGITSKFLLGVSASWARELAGGGTNFCRWTKQRVIGRCEPFLYNLVCSRRVIHFRMIQAYDGESRTQYMRMSHHYIFRNPTNG